MYKYLLLFSLFSCMRIGFAQKVMLKTLKGVNIEVSKVMQNKVTVFVFLSPECPLCQSYSLTLRNIYNTYKTKGINIVGIVPGKDYDALTISTFKHKYTIPFDIFMDEKLLWTNEIGATITPEVFVVGTKGGTLYSGRIDNWAYGVSKKRKIITQNNLVDALNSIVADKPIFVTRTKAIGCFIE